MRARLRLSDAAYWSEAVEVRVTASGGYSKFRIGSFPGTVTTVKIGAGCLLNAAITHEWEADAWVYLIEGDVSEADYAAFRLGGLEIGALPEDG
jgi:hypothetical protein